MDAAFQSGIASASLQVVLDRFSTFAIDQIGLVLGVDDEFRSLERAFLKIQAMLAHVDDNHVSNKTWQIWSKDLKKLLYDAEDLLDEIFLGLSRFSVDSSLNANMDNEIRDMLLSSFQLAVPNGIRQIRRELECVASEMNGALVTESVKSSASKTIARSPYCNYRCSSLVDERLIVGREKDKEEIVHKLLSDEWNNNLSVIPIVGMGGVGKTTLAQVIYNNEEVVKNFELRIWLSVSVEFDVIRITKSIIESITKNSCNLSDLDPIQIKLQNLLQGKKFLLVLDDFWSENYGDWDVLRSPFRVGSKGSKVIVTTRSTIVSSIVGTTLAHYLKCLCDDDCWELMKQRAFLGKNLDDYENLEVIGKLIAMKCKGLPLAAKTLGSVLQFKSNAKEWDDLLKTELWDLPQDKNNIFPALLLSYFHLPTHLKKCFAYCSIFPWRYGFEKDNLVLIWMAEGFIQCVGERRLEDIGNDYFNDLLWRSFFQHSHVDIENRTIYKMHELIHSMAQLVSADICFRLDTGMPHWCTVLRNARHLYLRHENLQSMPSKVFNRCKSLRTLLMTYEGGAEIGKIPYNLFSYLQCLRVLDMSQTGIGEVPNSIGNLKHLRYLNLSENRIQKLPESIADLFGLQTLKLKNCRKLLELPPNLKSLINLRHLDFDIKCQLNSMPPKIGRLINLQTLNAFIVGVDEGCRIEELRNMGCLRGSICITNLENVQNVTEAEDAMLKKKSYIEKLELEWNNFGDKSVQLEVLAGLQPHGSLKELQITNYGGIMFPSWLHNPLSCNMVSIHLQSCQCCKVLPPLGQLPFLKSLYIDGMHDLEIVDHHFCGSGIARGFPSLQLLKFHDMQHLKKWEGINATDMPSLSELTINDCPRLISLPSLHNLSSLENLDISRCPKLQSFPKEGLPSSLRILIILESDILKERCKVEEGEDWLKIRRIQKIEIDYVNIHVQATII